MNEEIKKIVDYAINECKPDKLLSQYLSRQTFHSGKLIVISIGKASWLMGKICQNFLSKKIDQGIVLTKYRHSQGNIPDFTIFEAGHPLTDNNSLLTTQAIIDLIKPLKECDDIIFLISGGGSSLMELPLIPLEQLQLINNKLLHSSASIQEINLIRKKLSQVKGGKLASLTKANIYNYILSDVIGNDLSTIASGPTVESKDNIPLATEINRKYRLNIPQNLLLSPFPRLNNVRSFLIGSNILLADSAHRICQKLGYQTTVVSTTVNGDINNFAREIIALANFNQHPTSDLAFIFSGELTLTVRTNGLGGRCQHLVALCLKRFSTLYNTTLIACGSDGTDGPTDADGGYCDQNIAQQALRYNLDEYINNCDSYNLLKKLNALIFTGPTNTNVNDLIILLIKKDTKSSI
ncbi:MAG: DUF4147 domain-containing protein [Erysipelotrichia bacterium]|nr:DUF4147 domain-containing protein [Erysipelotrichia bacterium]